MHLATHYQEIRSDRNNPYLLRFLFTLFCTLILTRFVVNANVLDSVMKYSAEKGAPLSRSFIRAPMVSSFFCSPHCCACGSSFSIGSAGTAKPYCVCRHHHQHRSIPGICRTQRLHWIPGRFVRRSVRRRRRDACVSSGMAGNHWCDFDYLPCNRSCVALGEFALQKRLLPYWATELSFRPTGLTEHPLQLGLFNATAINLVPLTRWKAASKVGVTIILLLGVFAAGARLASIVAVGSTFLVVVLAEWPSLSSSRRSQLKLALIIGGMLALPILLTMLIQMGLVDRFQQGLFDESAMARVSIYRLFDMVSWSEILLGADIGRIRLWRLIILTWTI